MRAKVFVSLKKSVLDPQGKTIHNSLRNLGYRNVADVRQGKFFDIVLDEKLSPMEAQQEVEKIAKSVLTNPVIEEYTYQIHQAGDPGRQQ